MNTSKDAKAANKAQKKQQKTLKKQQQQQQQQQKTKEQSEQKQSSNNSGSIQQIKLSRNATISHNNNNNNNDLVNNNNNNSAATNVSQKLKIYYEQQKLQQQQQQQQQQHFNSSKTLPGGNPSIILAYENVPKFERSSSFSLKGKLSKLINSITSSKENLNKSQQVEAENEVPFKFTRSRSMILPRRTNRRSLIEPQLEQLSEEVEKSSEATSPRKNSIETEEVSGVPFDTVSLHNSSSINSSIMNTTPIDSNSSSTAMHRKTSTPILTSSMADPNYDPVANFKKRRSSTFISSFRSTLAGITGASASEKKKDKLNDKWRASLQSLQAIDNMVSYENMSFIDYDKFNGYEKQLERKLSQISLMDPSLNGSLIPEPSIISDNSSYILAASPCTPSNASQLSPFLSTPQTVVRRRKTSGSLHGSARELAKRRSASRTSFNLDSDYEHNLDKPRNVYRESLDSRKLELLNDISRNSYILDSNLVDILDLAFVSQNVKHAAGVHCRPRYRRYVSHTTNCRNNGQDEVDTATGVQQLKSKSLTHLDGLESELVCNHAKHSNAVSSSEYFSVSFCTEGGCQEEEFFPAPKGVTLANALSQALRRRNLSFNQLTITDTNDNNPMPPTYLEAGSSPARNSLDENTEVENLAGHHLIITDREESRKTLQKAASFGSRTRPPRLLSSASTDESTEVNLSGKQIKQRWSGLFGVKNPQQSQLCELLNNYSKNGVPQKSPATLNFDHPDLYAAIHYLDNMHKSWIDIVESSEMSDSEVRIQTAIWELVTTEVDYIHCLQTVTDLFLACLEAVQEEGLLREVDQHRLFANIRDICEANLKFWTHYLYPMVSHSVQNREPLRTAFFQQGFITFATIFSPYKKYCAEQSSCQYYCKELNRTNSLFTSYLAWCESQKMCNRLRLADILVRPMQRLTKYGLLLAAIKKHLNDVDEIEAIDTMLHTTENFVFSVNNHLTTRQENERLKGVMARIESYDVVDTNNEQLDKLIKQHSQMFDLCAPMKGCAPHHVRHLFMEGDHKYKDNLGKADVHCFLLTDILLVCKSIAKKGLGTLKVIRQPYLTDRLIVQHSHNILSCVYLNEFQVAVSAFTLQCSEAKNWYEALKRTKLIYTRLKQSSLTTWDSMRFSGGGGGGSSGGGGGMGSYIGGIGGGGSIASAGTVDSLGIKKSPMNSSICSHVTSANNSHSGSVEWNDSRNISVDFEKTNSLSSDEGCTYLGAHGFPLKSKPITTISPQKLKVIPTSSNMLTVQPLSHLGQSLPNLNLHNSHTNNTLLVPGTANTATHSGTLLLSPCHRGISYPPPSPTRVPLRRGMAFSNSIKNPPLLKSRNITSQNSISWHPGPLAAGLSSPQTQSIVSSKQQQQTATIRTAPISTSSTNLELLQEQQHQENDSNNAQYFKQLSSNSTETDV